jgi:hypothetical protein
VHWLHADDLSETLPLEGFSAQRQRRTSGHWRYRKAT